VAKIALTSDGPRREGKTRMTAGVGAVREALRARVPVDDPEFDRLYPEHVRRLSTVHWTPVSVALRAAELLAPEPGARVLDVGAGAGKLCCVGALACGGTWHGIEIDPALVAAATTTARRLEVDHRTWFEAGEMDQLDWGRYDSLYFYNPFESLLFGTARHAGDAGWVAFADQVARAEARLSELPTDTRVVTFHGFGGEMPSSFERTFVEAIGDAELALWVQQPRSRAGRGRARRRVLAKQVGA
jgi:predicted RNA methylase